MIGKDYLGDSVYAEVENGMIKLTTENGFGASNTIYLDGRTMEALRNYHDRANEAAGHFKDERDKSL